jgi:hypothetical protein
MPQITHGKDLGSTALNGGHVISGSNRRQILGLSAILAQDISVKVGLHA